MGRTRRVLTAVVMVSQVACGDRTPAGSSAVLEVVRDSAGGAELVTVRGSLPRLELTPPIDLGGDAPAMDGSNPDDFAWVSSVSVTPAGHLLVADLGRFQIAVFDAATGSHIRNIGTRGDGPGEFESLFSVAPFGDDVLAMDIGNGRTSRLDISGEWIDQWRAAGRLVASPVDFHLYPVGRQEVYQWAYAIDDGLEVPVWRRSPSRVSRMTGNGPCRSSVVSSWRGSLGVTSMSPWCM